MMEFKLQGELTFKDYLQVALFHQRKLILMEMVFVVVVVFFALPYLSAPPLFKWASFIFFPFLGALFMFILIFIREKRNYSSLSKRFHEKEIQINEEGIQYGSKDSAASFKWSDIKRVDFPKGMILLYISTNQALLIPRRFFSSREEEKAYITFIRKSYFGRLDLKRGMK